ncbi:CocE/NonD family hydrolase [Rhizorhabdus wittichii]|uniref:CocE/NonD family hydrolase n=1 Tax=Rhizorhabdus wittichii TaxID=160791 RepID=UPI0002FEC9B3|nr:CocE/NonD family hydrolase [Rhizorhabdus wittichii]
MTKRHILGAVTLVAFAAVAAAQTPPMTPDIPPKGFDAVTPQADYVRREVMIPMRDGKKLFTVIVMRKGTNNAPILLTRTPYNAAKTTSRNPSQRIEEILPVADAEFVDDGYIRVYQDVRGRNGSEGDYVMNRPLRGPLNHTKVDHATDAWDTIDWLVKNLPESNGRVGMTGSSYPGFTTLMATIDPHPALRAVVPMSPMVDGWMGDDWFHNGAFRQNSYDYLTGQMASKDDGDPVASGTGDRYALWLKAGSAGDYARAYGLDAFPVARKMAEHPAYDDYWREQAVDRLLAARPFTVPMMLVVGQWDQEDSYGAPAVYRALKPKDKDGRLHLVVGPWRHSGVNYDGSALGPLRFTGDTALQFRRDVMKPFLDQYLKGGAPRVSIAPVLTYDSGRNRWQASAAIFDTKLKPLYLQAGAALDWNRADAAGKDDYVSDPAKPVPFLPRPIDWDSADVWKPWLVADQRFADGRPDVLTYVTEPLAAPVHILGRPMVDLFAATSGTDSDWVVKLIDVYPDEMSAEPRLAGYQLGIGMEIFRGRYVDGFDKPRALEPGKAEHYRFELPTVNHSFMPGHRIMVQVQSSWFPLYDRNPQSYVANIFDAKPGDYRKATQSVLTGGATASAILLPVVD